MTPGSPTNSHSESEEVLAAVRAAGEILTVWLSSGDTDAVADRVATVWAELGDVEGAALGTLLNLILRLMRTISALGGPPVTEQLPELCLAIARYDVTPHP